MIPKRVMVRIIKLKYKNFINSLIIHTDSDHELQSYSRDKNTY
jgi:tRNA A37 threonylcarbamoyladenosine synthetase subunit TsaC/SUA5/YrdC